MDKWINCSTLDVDTIIYGRKTLESLWHLFFVRLLHGYQDVIQKYAAIWT